MPPEQAGGEVEKVDWRADVFGLGAMLCVILTGRPPYVDPDVAAVRLMAVRGSLDEAQGRPEGCGAEPGLVELCRRCLSADPGRRPADARDVARAVAAIRTEAEDRAHRAELERARAEVQATGQRKRRKVQAALGLSFTALVLLAGGVAWWARDQRRTRREQAEREVNRAVEVAVARYSQARGADRDLALWAQARADAIQAGERADQVGAPAEVRERVRRLIAEIERVEKNRQLVATLLEIQDSMGDVLLPNGLQDFPGADARYERAFRDYGTDVLKLPPEEAAGVLRNLGGDVRVELAAALDDWVYVRWFLARRRADVVVPLFRITRLLDPDPLRKRVRDAILAKDRAGLDRLAEEIDPANQPVQTVKLVGVYPYLYGDTARAIRSLRKAHLHHPGSLQINHNLAFLFNELSQPDSSQPMWKGAHAARIEAIRRPRPTTAWAHSSPAAGNTSRR